MKQIISFLLITGMLTGLISGCAIDEPEVSTSADSITTSETTAAPLAETSTAAGREESKQTEDPVGSDPTDDTYANTNVDSSFFDDAVFVGDSVSLKLSYYADATGLLGEAQFLVKGSYSIAHASYNSMLLSCQGQKMRIEDAIECSGADKLFIMLGTNDIGYISIEDTMSNWETVIGRIQDQCPHVHIYIQSCMPIYTDGQIGNLNNESMDLLNLKLQAFAKAHGCDYVDVASYLKDSTNGLAAEYCSDSFVHLTNAGAAAWVEALKAEICWLRGLK